jgi:hypothetical protein
MFKSRHPGSKHTHGSLEAAGCLLSSPVMSCSESIDLIDGTDSDQEGVEPAYSHCPRKLGMWTSLHDPNMEEMHLN